MKQKFIALVSCTAQVRWVLAFGMGLLLWSTTLAGPAFAEEGAAEASALMEATSEYHIDYAELGASAVNDQGNLYLPLRASLAALGVEVVTSPDGQGRKLLLNTSSGPYELYYSSDKTAIAASSEGPYSPVRMVGDTCYVPLAFIQELTNRVVSVSDSTLLLIKVDDTLPVLKALVPYSVEAAWQLGQGVVDSAMDYLGVPYVWGGTTPAGFDCSGLVQYVYAENGVGIGRTTYEQQAQASPIDPAELAPGDLVFWGAPAYHVGIYIGDGQYIHAPAPGQCVKVQSASEYAFTSAGRI